MYNTKLFYRFGPKPVWFMFCVILVAIFFSGCAGAPVGWGGKYEVLLKNEKSITLEYDELISSYKAITVVAQSHCEEYGKVAIPEGETTTRANGLVKTHTFVCE